jgi:four helix bundle protein
MQDFRKLQVWQKAHRLTLDVISVSSTFSHPGWYFLRDQLRRSVISIPANLAEGCGRAGDREMRRFARVSLGSASELEYHLLLARDLGLMTPDAYGPLAAQTVEVKRMLSGLVSRLTHEIVSKSASKSEADS